MTATPDTLSIVTGPQPPTAPYLQDAMQAVRADPPAGTTTQRPSGPGTDASVDNSVIRQMRATVEAAQREAQEAKKTAEALAKERETLAAELKKLQDAQLSDAERQEKELEELRPLRDEVGRYTNAFKQMYEAELAAVPEAQREAVERLSQVGSWDERLQLLRNAKSLLPPLMPAPITPQAMGTTTNPGQRDNALDPPKLDPKRAPTLREAFQMEPARGPTFSSKQLIAKLDQMLG